jgi:hypothetical protein
MVIPALMRAKDGKSKPPNARGRVDTIDDGQKGKPRLACMCFMILWSSLIASAWRIGWRESSALHQEMMFCDTILHRSVKGVRNEKAGKEKESIISTSSRKRGLGSST